MNNLAVREFPILKERVKLMCSDCYRMWSKKSNGTHVGMIKAPLFFLMCEHKKEGEVF